MLVEKTSSSYAACTGELNCSSGRKSALTVIPTSGLGLLNSASSQMLPIVATPVAKNVAI